MKRISLLLSGLGLAGVVLYLALGAANVTEWGHDSARDEDYNLLVEGFQKGQLDLNKEAPPGLALLPDPYDPVANARYRAIPYRLDDLSYYRGKLYFYFGATPGLLLFWPWAAFTGHYLFQRVGCAIFCGVGFVASLALLQGLIRRYFPETPAWIAGLLAAALGLVSSATVLLQKADVWEVPIACGYALSLLALGAVWQALHDPARRTRWIVLASLGLGLAISSRPALLFGAAIVLVPLFPAGRPDRRIGPWLAALLPLGLCGAAVMAFNAARFGSPLEYGARYMLGLYRQDIARHFSVGYLGYNFWVYFLEPMRWSADFPFVRDAAVLPMPPGHGVVEDPFGALTGMPFLFAALAAPLAWRGRPAGEAGPLRGFVAASAILFLGAALMICLFYGNCSRYELDFLPTLALLAAAGILGAERALAARPRRRLAVRITWIAALGLSLAFILLLSVQHYADQRYRLGNAYMASNRPEDAVVQYDHALAAEPSLADAQGNLGAAFFRLGRYGDATAADQAALRLAPGSALAHYNLAGALRQSGRLAEAQAEYERAYQLRPDLRR
ncbi:MAG TPA: tetratricopeptide repeat protein [Opitutaceae bacterium]|nr:tetratricopeptide repeat protein [Opitutaceae bacterium]